MRTFTGRYKTGKSIHLKYVKVSSTKSINILTALCTLQKPETETHNNVTPINVAFSYQWLNGDACDDLKTTDYLSVRVINAVGHYVS